MVCTEHRWPGSLDMSEQMLQHAIVLTSTDAGLAGTFLDGERLGKHEHRQLRFNDSVISFGVSPLKFRLIGEHPSELCYGPQLDPIRSVMNALPHSWCQEHEQPSKSKVTFVSGVHVG